jgi:acetyl esterase/lipase
LSIAQLELWRRSKVRSHPEIETLEVPYARVGGRELRLWVNRPRGGGLHPAMLDLHGGAWTHFDHHVDFVWCEGLARRGFAMVSVEFRLAPEHPWPTFLCDVRAAARWVRAHGAEIGVDAGALGAIGGSTGGHLALMLGMLPRDPEGRVTPALDTPDDGVAGVGWVVANYPIVDVLGRYQMIRAARFDPVSRAIGAGLRAALRLRGERLAGTRPVEMAGPVPRLGNPDAPLRRIASLRATSPRLGDAFGWSAQKLLWGVGRVPALKVLEYPGVLAAHDGAFACEAQMVEASPIEVVRRRALQRRPPLLIVQGRGDPNMTDEMTYGFATAYDAAGGEVRLCMLDGYGHGFGNVPSPQSDHMMDLAEQHARESMGGTGATRAAKERRHAGRNGSPALG